MGMARFPDLGTLSMTIREQTHIIIDTLQPLYDDREAAAIAKALLQARLSLPAHELALRGGESLAAGLVQRLAQDVEKLEQGTPLQYVLGEAEFYGLTLKVTPATLIPRSETEELVTTAVERCRELVNPSIWDVGTGSGCIAIALAKHLPNATVFATDISDAALAVARENADTCEVNITFALHDMTETEHIPFAGRKFDLIVSNPPYIPQSVRAELHRNVADYEPATALFVPDDDPLVCYRALANIGTACLAPKGILIAETFENFHNDLKIMFKAHGYRRFESLKDINGRKRMIITGE